MCVHLESLSVFTMLSNKYAWLPTHKNNKIKYRQILQFLCMFAAVFPSGISGISCCLGNTKLKKL